MIRFNLKLTAHPEILQRLLRYSIDFIFPAIRDQRLILLLEQVEELVPLLEAQPHIDVVTLPAVIGEAKYHLQAGGLHRLANIMEALDEHF